DFRLQDLDESEPGIPQVDGVDLVLRDGYVQFGAVNGVTAPVADHRRAALTPQLAVDPVQLDKKDGPIGRVGVGYAALQARPDVRQVRVGIAGFVCALRLRQLHALVELVVTVVGTCREERTE